MDGGTANVLQILLNKASAADSWGFRLQGGTDYDVPLSVQSVAEKSIACQCGLTAGDAVLQINGNAATTLEHEEAKRQIVSSGNKVLLTIQREGAKVWKPNISLQSGGGFVGNEPGAVRFSLAANKQELPHIGSQFNVTAKPFSTAQSQEACVRPVGFQVNMDEWKKNVQEPPQAIICHNCGQIISGGAFPRVNGKPFHPDCFTCSACGKNLRNFGYYFQNGQLLCEQHVSK